MRVLLNRFSTIGHKTGIGQYTSELLKALQRLAPGEVSGYPAGWTWRLARAWGASRGPLARDERSTPVSQAASAPPASAWARARQGTLAAVRRLGQRYLTRALRAQLTRGGFDLYHEPNTIPFPCDHPTVTTLPDLSVLLHPEWHPPARVAFYEKHFLPSLRRSRHFIAISDFTRRQVIDCLRIAPERVTRAHLGVHPSLAPLPRREVADGLRRLDLPPRYLLFVGAIEPRKNLLMLLRAYGDLPERVRRECPLVLVGTWGWSCADVAAYLKREGRASGVLHVGYASDAQRSLLYNGARALVFPSFYEGFGLPPLEMLACGGAVLASTAEALVEVVGRQAHLIDPHDTAGWRDAMGRVITDDDWWRGLRSGAVEAARPFTWERCAEQTLAVYRRVCGLTNKETPRKVAWSPLIERRLPSA